jgi:hypothetical protein
MRWLALQREALDEAADTARLRLEQHEQEAEARRQEQESQAALRRRTQLERNRQNKAIREVLPCRMQDAGGARRGLT